MDEALTRGLAQMLAARETDFFNGGQRLGWKVGFNAPAAQEALGLDGPIVGYLTNTTLLPDGATVSLDGFTGTPLVEKEIAVRIGDDGAITAQAAALEVVDLGDPRIGVERVLAGNIFHHGVILGEFTQDLSDLSEDARSMVDRVADLLEHAGERLQAGDVVITGALVIEPAADEVSFDYGALGSLSVRFDA